MSFWSDSNSGSTLLSPGEGELVSLCASVEPRALEDFLEALAEVPFPINPEIHHLPQASVLVEFPAFSRHVDEVRGVLTRHGFNPAALQVKNMLKSISSR